ncbi:MAG: glycosyl hydrolase [Bacteroidia bacterium]|nr:glycosyl hydrolase [Bacteroidia bacterium]
MKTIPFVLTVATALALNPLSAQKPVDKKSQKPTTVAATGVADSLVKPILGQVNFRMIGPATTSGRIVDIAVNPLNKAEYYIAAAYGGVWKTTNGGTTYQPIFDGYGTQSIGCLALDPKNPNILWVGTGENNNQRSVGYGNSIYRSLDGGKTFENMGLKLSEHIGMIKIDPSNSNRIWVAVYGPVWKEGGERGLYLTEDGGKTWVRNFHVSDNTGCNEIYLDPNMPGTMYAAFHQRRRHEWTYLGGGPESALYKSTDNGKTWRKLAGGLPGGELGRITIGVSALKAGLVYAMVEAEEGKGGIFVSYDYGESWSKQNPFFTAGNYYQELFVDPTNPNRIFVMDAYMKVSDDGGKTLRNAGEGNKHVDNHVIWIDPAQSSHWLVGCDGGLYETFDNAQHWNYKDNISITQFYRASVDNASPFYNIYGGTQDNNTLGGPAKNNSANGVSNDDWYVTVGGDGFKSQIDPTNPNIVYSQWQYGGLVRYDKVTGEAVDIKPTIGVYEAPLRWNWDAPLIISRSNPKVLYFAANRVFKSEDRGDSWTPISGDLSRGIDRNTLPIMGKVWGVNAVVKNQSTSIYGNITTLSEGKNGELYAGTDDGLVWRKEANASTWLKCGAAANGELNFPEAPKGQPNGVGHPFISMVYASPNSGNVYVVLDHHRFGDFKPYVYKSTNGGATWTKITKGLPENGPVKTVIEDFKDQDIVLVGTEFGLHISFNGGAEFHSWQGGMPPTAVKDMVFQERDDDLVLATFGRGFAVCDDYEKIREFKAMMTADAVVAKRNYILPVTSVKLFIPASPLGGSGNGHKGASRFAAPNPATGAVIVYNIEKEFSTIASRRKKRETDAAKNSNALIYPAKDSIVLESMEEASKVYMVIRSSQEVTPSNVVAKYALNAAKGLAKTEWNLRYSDPSLPVPTDKGYQAGWGPYVTPGTYYASLELMENGNVTNLTGVTEIKVSYLYEASIAVASVEEKSAQVAKLFQVKQSLSATNLRLDEIQTGINAMKNAVGVPNTNARDFAHLSAQLQLTLNQVNLALNGNAALAAEEFETTEGLNELFGSAYYSCMDALNAPTKTHLQKLDMVNASLVTINAQLGDVVNQYNAMASQYPLLRLPVLR